MKEEVVQEWARRLKDKCEGYALKDIFNADETGHFSFVAREVAFAKECKGGKLSKDRLTILLCGSASGEKLMPLVIGRSTNSRNNKAWMTGELFAAWMRRVDNRIRRQNRHILLFLDNCGSHPHMELENVKVVFLPPNTTSKLQPMDAGIIQNLKMVYRKKLLRHIIFLVDADGIRHCEESHRVGYCPVANIRLGQRQVGNDQQVLPEVRVF